MTDQLLDDTVIALVLCLVVIGSMWLAEMVLDRLARRRARDTHPTRTALPRPALSRSSLPHDQAERQRAAFDRTMAQIRRDVAARHRWGVVSVTRTYDSADALLADLIAPRRSEA